MATHRIGVLRLIHDHVWGVLNHFADDDRVQLVAVAEHREEELAKAASDYGLTNQYATPEELLANEELDAVLIFADNAGTAPLTEAAAARGLHVLTEKPMAATRDQAERMLLAAQNAGTVLMINWPTYWNAGLRWACEQARAGAFGQIFQIRYRGGHRGPREIGCSDAFCEWLYDRERNGGGTLTDYGGYGASLSVWVLGRPGSVSAAAGRLVKDDIPVDDNMLIILRYPNTFGLLEGTWTQPTSRTNGLILYGTEAVVTVGYGGVVIDRGDGDPETIDPPPLAEPATDPANYFLHCIEAGEAPEGQVSPAASRDAQEILEAAKTAAATGGTVPLPLA